jgi:uncharacterized membrane protein
MSPHSQVDDTNQPDRPPTAAAMIRAPFRRRLRAYFLTGIVVAAPLAITAYITLWFINFIGRRMAPLIEPFVPTSIEFIVPVVGVVLMACALTLLGALATNLAGRSLVHYGERLLARVPVVRTIYKTLKNIIETLIHQSRGAFTKAGLIEYPRPGVWSVVFIAANVKGEILERANVDEMVSVFLPTIPNPTTGFLIFVPRKDLIVLDMSVEEAAKLILSVGLVAPPSKPISRQPAQSDSAPGASREKSQTQPEKLAAQR